MSSNTVLHADTRFKVGERTLIALPADGGSLTSAPDVSGLEEMPMLMAPGVLAKHLQVSTKSLERWRDAKTGPAWHILPGTSMIRYSRADVIAWLNAGRKGETK